jgi:dihydroxyacid dehydratase/phosphogluconate dehydratase
MNWTEEDLGKPQVLVDSAYGMGHPGTFHFREPARVAWCPTGLRPIRYLAWTT